MSTITKEEIIKLSRMSQIELTDREIELLVPDLQAVLDYASSLNKIAQQHKNIILDSSCTENVLREDEIIVTSPDPLLKQAPEREDRFFVVPQVVKQEREK